MCIVQLFNCLPVLFVVYLLKEAKKTIYVLHRVNEHYSKFEIYLTSRQKTKQFMPQGNKKRFFFLKFQALFQAVFFLIFFLPDGK